MNYWVRESFSHEKDAADKLEKVTDAFDAVAVLIQYDIENGHLLLPVQFIFEVYVENKQIFVLKDFRCQLSTCLLIEVIICTYIEEVITMK